MLEVNVSDDEVTRATCFLPSLCGGCRYIKPNSFSRGE